jgi:hypothetical protein
VRKDTKRHFHLGVNFLVTPPTPLGPQRLLQFQAKLADPVTGIVFNASDQLGETAVFVRRDLPLEVRVGPVGPQVSQLLITAPNPNRLLEDFMDECDGIISAYREVWKEPVQIIGRDCTVRHLYAGREAHAFEFLWQSQLGQSEERLSKLGRPVLGGGLRLFMPPSEAEPAIEVKIESLFADASQLFVEVALSWPIPRPIAELEARSMLQTAEQYIDEQIADFIALED